MWRAFGGQNTARVALVFSMRKDSNTHVILNILFSPVAYLTELEAHGVIDEVISNVVANCEFLRSVDRSVLLGMVFVTFLAGVTCLKHEGFNEEREWRAIYSPKLTPSSLIEFSIETVGGIPQPVYKIPLDATGDPALATLDLSSRSLGRRIESARFSRGLRGADSGRVSMS